MNSDVPASLSCILCGESVRRTAFEKHLTQRCLAAEPIAKRSKPSQEQCLISPLPQTKPPKGRAVSILGISLVKEKLFRASRSVAAIRQLGRAFRFWRPIRLIVPPERETNVGAERIADGLAHLPTGGLRVLRILRADLGSSAVRRLLVAHRASLRRLQLMGTSEPLARPSTVRLAKLSHARLGGEQNEFTRHLQLLPTSLRHLQWNVNYSPVMRKATIQSLVAKIAELPQLRSLCFPNNHLTDILLARSGTLQRITSLVTEVSSTDLLRNCESLESLSTLDINFANWKVEESLRNLRSLTLTSCKPNCELNTYLRGLERLSGLRHLSLAMAPLPDGGAQLGDVTQWTGLSELALESLALRLRKLPAELHVAPAKLRSLAMELLTSDTGLAARKEALRSPQQFIMVRSLLRNEVFPLLERVELLCPAKALDGLDPVCLPRLTHFSWGHGTGGNGLMVFARGKASHPLVQCLARIGDLRSRFAHAERSFLREKKKLETARKEAKAIFAKKMKSIRTKDDENTKKLQDFLENS